MSHRSPVRARQGVGRGERKRNVKTINMQPYENENSCIKADVVPLRHLPKGAEIALALQCRVKLLSPERHMLRAVQQVVIGD